jgi:hypothetical protein
VEAIEERFSTFDPVGPNPSGLCQCKCGQPAPIAEQSDTKRGIIKGQPRRFILGHHAKKGPNAVRHLSDGTSVFILERRDGSTLDCFIDTADYDTVKSFRWSAVPDKQTFYAHTGFPRRTTLHRLLFPDSEEVDHRDHNGLNNRRSNLRLATGLQNARNKAKSTNRVFTSRYKGVSFVEHGNWQRFKAGIRVNGKDAHLGFFESEEEAARAYDAAATERFGEFACLNFPKKEAA